jgi:hypothetical protein
VGEAQLFEEAGQAQVVAGETEATGQVAPGTGEPGFARAGRAGDTDIVMGLDPLAGEQGATWLRLRPRGWR